jgi:hypothetical protein
MQIMMTTIINALPLEADEPIKAREELYAYFKSH